MNTNFQIIFLVVSVDVKRLQVRLSTCVFVLPVSQMRLSTCVFVLPVSQ